MKALYCITYPRESRRTLEYASSFKEAKEKLRSFEGQWLYCTEWYDVVVDISQTQVPAQRCHVYFSKYCRDTEDPEAFVSITRFSMIR